MSIRFYLKQIAKMMLQQIYLPVVYRLHAIRRPDRNLVLFADAHHNDRPESMQLLYEALTENAESPLKVQEMYLDYAGASFRRIMQHMTGFMKAYALAGTVVICDNFLPAASCRKRKETQVIQLWHASGALKKFGYDTTDDIPAFYRGNVFRNTDCVTVSSPFCVSPFASAMRLDEEKICPLGVSRTDRFFSDAWKQDTAERFYSAYPEAEGRRIILWAPTFRGHPGEMKLSREDMDAVRLAAREDDYVLIKPHPHMSTLPGVTDSAPAFSTEALFCVADILIADYSSLILDYLLSGKRLILYTPDLEAYTAARGFYMDFDEIPCERAADPETLRSLLHSETPPASPAGDAAREAFLRRYMSGCDGHATERIAERIFTHAKAEKPANRNMKEKRNVRGMARLAARDLYKTWTLKHLYPGLYRREAGKRPVNPRKIVLAEVRTEKLSDSFQCVLRALKSEGKWEITTLTLREGLESRSRVRARAMRAIRQMADAAYIFTNDSSYLLGAVRLRPETKMIQLWHACGAFKKFGYSIADKKFGSTKAQLDRYPMYRNFSYVTVSSEEVIWAYAQAFGLEEYPERFVATGISRTDVFFDPRRVAQAQKKLKRFLQDRNIPDGKKVILYAPTFRGNVAGAFSPEQMDLQLLSRRIGEKYVLLINHHPFVKNRPVIPGDLSWFAADVTGAMTIEDLIMTADVCITDYSSMVFEYALMQRPIVFFTPDIEEYNDWRGFYYPFEELTPGPVCTQTEEIAAYICSLRNGFDTARIRAFRDKFMGACDGKATERILRLLSADDE